MSKFNPQPKNIDFKDIEVGQIYEFEHVFTKEHVHVFAQLTGDFNPLHTDEQFVKHTRFGQNVVHGMLVGSLFSQLVGMHCPGKNNLYLSQSLEFKRPVFFDDRLTVRGTIIKKTDSIRMVVLRTEILKNQQLVVSGEAKVMVMDHA